MTDKKPWWKSKTVWVGITEVVLGAAQTVAETPVLGDKVTGIAIGVAGILTIALRLVTGKPLQ